MALRHAGQAAREAWTLLGDLALGRFPGFVLGGPLPPGDIPVFVFHSLEPRTFARRLQHLADNGYATLSAHQYLCAVSGARRVPERAVLLTFDDGRGSVWSVGEPLLRRHGMRAVVFLVPGRMRSRPGPPAPTWNEVEAGDARAQTVLGREREDGALLSWEEVAALARTGRFEFQSHTLSHARVHVAPRLEGFATPAARRGYAAFDLPLIHAEGRDHMGEEVPLGTPLLRSAPRTSELLRFYEDPALRRACLEAVQAEGERFFTRPGWQRRLRRLVGRRLGGRMETPAEREQAIRNELVESKRMIEARTGRDVIHLCYPWHTWGPTARRLARDVGYRTAFCGKVPGVPLTRAGDDTLAVARLGEDWLLTLPGAGRVSLASVLARKWTARLRGGV
jgi:peptidoglycan/xylan/chitin deacetylase (PgdA/CDA1 family)